jgi:hypothetical protein
LESNGPKLSSNAKLQYEYFNAEIPANVLLFFGESNISNNWHALKAHFGEGITG